MRFLSLLIATALLSSCMSTTPGAASHEREWAAIMTDYTWIDSVRRAHPPLSSTASRKQMIEASLETHRKIDAMYGPFTEKLRDYYERTHDARARSLMAREKIIAGDEYFSLLSRYDKALEYYRAAQEIEPSAEAAQRIAMAEARRFVSIASFEKIRTGMKEDQVRAIVGLPREDWIKQVVQNGRVFAVWIYPRDDGGASAIYFDNGVVYHTNWNAAAPPAPPAAQ